MAYSSEGGRVTLEMETEDYNRLMRLGLLAASISTSFRGDEEAANAIYRLYNRLNEGNPEWRGIPVPDGEKEIEPRWITATGSESV